MEKVRRRIFKFWGFRLFQLVTLSLLLIFISCGQKKAKKEVTIKQEYRSIQFAATGFPFGVMIFGKNYALNQSFTTFLVDENDVKTFTLDNGMWEFYAMGFEDSNRFSGTYRCGHVAKDLNGEDVDVSLSMLAENCHSLSLAGHISSSNFLPLTVVSCSNNIAISAATTDCSSFKGTFGSYRVVFPEMKDGTISSNLNYESNCFNDANAVDSVTNSSEEIPVGFSRSPFYTQIKAYNSSNCSGGIQKVFEFPHGLSQPSPSAFFYLHNNKTRIFLQGDNSISFAPTAHSISIDTALIVSSVSTDPVLTLTELGSTTTFAAPWTVTGTPATPSSGIIAITQPTSTVSSLSPTFTDLSGTPRMGDASFTATATVSTTFPAGATKTCEVLAPYAGKICNYPAPSITLADTEVVDGSLIVKAYDSSSPGNFLTSNSIHSSLITIEELTGINVAATDDLDSFDKFI